MESCELPGLCLGLDSPLNTTWSNMRMDMLNQGLDSPREDGRHHVVVQFCLVHFQKYKNQKGTTKWIFATPGIP